MAAIRPVPADWSARIADLARRVDEPWFRAYAPTLRALASEADELDVATIDRLLAPRAEVRFERQTSVRRRGEPFAYDTSYDGSITRRGIVPTREGSMHDLMNAVVWAAHPRGKRALHARQDAALTREIAPGRTALPGRRSRLRDRLSMLDEGGVLVWSRTDGATLDRALATADLDTIRALVLRGEVGARVIGHAILEHATDGDPHEVRGCVVRLEDGAGEAHLDGHLTRALERDEETIERWIARLPSIPIGALFA